MNPEQCYAAWAPDDSIWAPWAKPVLFASMDKWYGDDLPADVPADLAARLPAARPDLALVVDLPGADSLSTGLGLAQRGFRPVPLYNGTVGPSPVVDVGPVAQRLIAGAHMLSALPLRGDAPPAFLLDANRMNGTPQPGRYDNRWIVLPQDFPSAVMLRRHGIREVWLLSRTPRIVLTDLEHVLLRWQQGGVRLRTGNPAEQAEPAELVVSEPSGFRKAAYRLLALMGYKRSNIGGFGAFIPQQVEGGHGFG